MQQGGYLYTCNTTGNQNYTANSTSSALNISKNQSGCSLTIFPSNPTYNSTTTASCSCTNPEENATLYRNGTDVTSENGIATVLPAGAYLYVCNVSETENCTSASNSSNHSVAKAQTNLTIIILPSSSVSNTTQTNVSCAASNGEVALTLYRNGTPVSNPDIQTLGIGNYTYVCNTTGSQNYSPASANATLRVNPPSGGGGGGGALDDFTVSLNYSCAGAPLKVNASTSNARVELLELDGSSYSLVEYKFSNSQGIATFQVDSEGSYKIVVTKSGYNDYSQTFRITCTEEAANCTSDSDCPADERCSGGNCIGVPCECGYLSGHACVEYACCSDSDCTASQVCSNHACQSLECGNCSYAGNHACVQYECCSDSACPSDSKCDAYSCVQVPCACGYVSNHACTPYACCSNSDCAAGKNCVNHACVSAQPGGNVTPGEQPNVTFIYDKDAGKLKITVKDSQGNALAGYSITLKMADGSTRTFVTGPDGEIIIDVSGGLPFQMLSPFQMDLTAGVLKQEKFAIPACSLSGVDLGGLLGICWYWWGLIIIAAGGAYLLFSLGRKQWKGGR